MIVVFFIVIYSLIIRNIVRIKFKTLKAQVTRGDNCDSRGEISTTDQTKTVQVTISDNCDSSGELSTTVQTKTEAKDTPTDLDSGKQSASNVRHGQETHAKDMRPEIKLTIMTFVITVVLKY